MRIRRHWRVIIGWGSLLGVMAVLGYWLVDDATGEERRLRRLVEAERRSRPVIPVNTDEKGGAATTLDDLRLRFGGNTAPKNAVAIPEVSLPEPEFDSESALAVEIEFEIRHRWIAGSLDRAGQEVPAYLAAVGIVAGTSHLAKLRDHYELDIPLTKLQLVRLVRLLAAAGYEFRSWQPPYPDNCFFLGRAAAPVRYQAVFE